ncbi:membrane protein [Mycolicibacterium flavescens]|nr:membrane protein [Mycolicibacterium flavescens]
MPVVLFFELLLVAATLVITWFALYAVYRLITDES